ncbi:RnfABCDGE type electron transport complex subunit B [Bacteroidales bacterium OttesenSCG-928-B11]|nr:RnfABCDGE type electron transport complex subunit B [Bacteroidales bacterium OttesenSCG-928-C03]MDL2311588.1 RnfABCDGE type electron transport complex subunit B [Bacteroidales bacterium OttesenSCG-928-B11]
MSISIILLAAAVLGAIAIIAAVILYFVSKAFRVIEDPRIDEVADLLPAANCGGCGFAGCRNFAEAIVKAGSMEGLNCPAGGESVVNAVAAVLGLEAVLGEPQIAVVRCQGSCEFAPAKSHYEGAPSCSFANSLFVGESACPNGCLGLGDCVRSCNFDAIYIDDMTKLPVIDNEKCVACGACVKACPRMLVELRNKGKKDRRIFVSCRNTEKGAAAKRNCSVACIGCGKCLKACAFEAITLKNNLAYIDSDKCKLCRKCVAECPTGAIVECNFPPKKEQRAAEEIVNEPANN